MPGNGRAERECLSGRRPERQGDDHVMQANEPVPPPEPRGAQVNELLPLGDWLRHHSLRSWPVLLFLVLICVPSIALVISGVRPSISTFDDVAWIFAAYFALAWLLLLGVIIRPENVTRPMLVVLTVIALATQVPLALTLETKLHGSNATLGPSIFTVGLPEEVAKAVPIVAVALIYWRRRRALVPRDYLFLGAVSGLVFGASEVVHYFTVNGVASFYSTVQSDAPHIRQLITTGHSAATSVFAVLIGPVLYFVLDFVWRFLTDSITHACWSGLTGYFIGLAVTGRYKWYQVAWIGVAIAAVLHGLNDWSRVNGHPLWIVVVIISGILFLGYAKVGSRGDLHLEAGGLSAALRLHGPPARHAVESGDGHADGKEAAHPATTTAGQPAPGAPTPSAPAPRRHVRPWWEH
jgi:RsiW-degrading membrane proteinase PrsW (M82 family)